MNHLEIPEADILVNLSLLSSNTMLSCFALVLSSGKWVENPVMKKTRVFCLVRCPMATSCQHLTVFLVQSANWKNGSRALRGLHSFTSSYTIKFSPLWHRQIAIWTTQKILKFWVWKSHFHGWLIAQRMMYLNVLKWYTETPLNAMKIIIPLFRVCLCVCAPALVHLNVCKSFWSSAGAGKRRFKNMNSKLKHYPAFFCFCEDSFL